MKAKVTKDFAGAPDGEIYPKNFQPGDDVYGELAKIAVANGWAEEIAEDGEEKASKGKRTR